MFGQFLVAGRSFLESMLLPMRAIRVLHVAIPEDSGKIDIEV